MFLFFLVHDVEALLVRDKIIPGFLSLFRRRSIFEKLEDRAINSLITGYRSRLRKFLKLEDRAPVTVDEVSRRLDPMIEELVTRHRVDLAQLGPVLQDALDPKTLANRYPLSRLIEVKEESNLEPGNKEVETLVQKLLVSIVFREKIIRELKPLLRENLSLDLEELRKAWKVYFTRTRLGRIDNYETQSWRSQHLYYRHLVMAVDHLFKELAGELVVAEDRFLEIIRQLKVS